MTVLAGVIRFALTSALRSRRTALTILVTLAFGISVSVTIFAIVNAVLLRPFPFAHPERLVVMSEFTREVGDTSVAYPNFLDWQRSTVTLDAMAAIKIDRVPVRLRRGAEEVTICLISSNLTSMLGVRPIIGNGFPSADDRTSGGRHALLSWELWQRELGGDANVVGRGMMIDGRLFTIAGVMPRGFQIPLATEAEIWVPFGPWIVPQKLDDRGTHGGIDVIGSRKPGVMLAAVRADMDRIAAALAAAYPRTNRDFGVLVEDLRERVVAGIRPILLILLAGAIVVFLIAGSNAATILLARVTSRQHDFAVKMAIGATPSTVVLEVIVEVAALATAGAAIACLVAFAALRELQRSAADLPRIATASLDAKVFLFALAAVVLTALIAGLPPALRVMRQPLTATLKQAPADAASGWRLTRVRGLLIGLQFAFTAALLIPATLLVLSFTRVRQADLGFSPDGVLTMMMSIPGNRFPTREDRRTFLVEFLRRLEKQGIEAAITSPMPLAGTTRTSAFTAEGSVRSGSGTPGEVELFAISPSYFKLMQIQLRAGRTFTESDRHSGRSMVVVDELFAESQWPGTNPIGRRLQLSPVPSDSHPWLEVIGVVRRVESQGLGSDVFVQAYVPYWSNIPTRPAVLVANTPSLAPKVTSIARTLDSEVPIAAARPLADYQDTLLLSRSLASTVLVIFASAAVVLAGFGLYGLVSYTIALRRREMGIRLSLGATPRQVWLLVARQLLMIAAAGVLFGVAGAYAIAPALTQLLYETSPQEVPVYVSVALILLAFAAPIALFPARRAANVQPSVLLND